VTFWTLRRLVGVGLLVQFALAPLSAHALDPYVWYNTAQTVVARHGPLYPFPQPPLWNYVYPPTWAGILALVWGAYAPLAPTLHAHPLPLAQLDSLLGVSVNLGAPLVPDWWFLLLVKTPIILCELATAFLVRKIVAERFGRPELATRAFALYFLNPYVIWIGSVWGMFDAIPTFFGLLGTLWLLDRRELWSGLSFGLAVSLKYFPALLILALVLGLRRPRGRPLLLFLGGFAAVLGAVSAPFLLTAPVGYIHGVLSPSNGATVGTLSVWALAPQFGVTTLPNWVAGVNLVLIAIIVAVVAWWVGRRRSLTDDPGLWLDLSAVALLAFFALFRTLNNQYITWIFPYLAISVALRRERPTLLVVLSSVALLYTLFTVDFYSFFLPILTISPTLTWLVPRMYAVPPLARALAVLFWVVVVVALVDRVRRARGYRGPSIWRVVLGPVLVRIERRRGYFPGSGPASPPEVQS
jgi:glycosyl transferase family 87